MIPLVISPQHVKRVELPPIRNTTAMSCQTFSLPNAPDGVHVNDTIYC